MSKASVSKGIFHKGFQKGAGQGKAPATVDMQTVKTSKFSPQTEKGRMEYSVKKGLTEDNMRKPFGG